MYLTAVAVPSLPGNPLRCWRSSSAKAGGQNHCCFGHEVLPQALPWLFGAQSPLVAHGAVCPRGLLLRYWHHPAWIKGTWMILKPFLGQADSSSPSSCLSVCLTLEKHPKRFSHFAAFSLKQHLPKNANVGFQLFGPLCLGCRGCFITVGLSELRVHCHPGFRPLPGDHRQKKLLSKWLGRFWGQGNHPNASEAS